MRYCQTLSPISERMRSKIGRAYRSMGGRRGRLNDDLRAVLSEAIFQVENDLEHRQPKHDQVLVMRTVRNRLYDDLGWNESMPPSSTPPDHRSGLKAPEP